MSSIASVGAPEQAFFGSLGESAAGSSSSIVPQRVDLVELASSRRLSTVGLSPIVSQEDREAEGIRKVVEIIKDVKIRRPTGARDSAYRVEFTSDFHVIEPRDNFNSVMLLNHFLKYAAGAEGVIERSGCLFNYAIHEEQGGDALLREILQDLSEVDEESREEGFELCSQKTKDNAEFVVKKIYERFPYRYEIYPSEDCEVAIDIDEGHGKGRGVLILCDPEGGASCFAVFGAETRSAHYSSVDKFLNSSFLREALLEFKEHSERTT